MLFVEIPNADEGNCPHGRNPLTKIIVITGEILAHTLHSERYRQNVTASSEIRTSLGTKVVRFVRSHMKRRTKFPTGTQFP